MIQLILNKVLKLFGQSLVKNLNGDVGGNLRYSNSSLVPNGVQVVTQVELYWIAIGGLAMSAIMLFAGWFHYHKAALN
jgi:photosystem I P700 chlorophyll a apoprotein A1